MRNRLLISLSLSVLAVFGLAGPASAGPPEPIPCVKPLWCE